MLVVALSGVITAIAVPMMGNTLGFFRVSGDSRNVSNAVALGKMRAAAVFGRVRLFVDLNDRSFHLEKWDKDAATWTAETGATRLSQGVTFSFGVVGTAPPNTQTVIDQAGKCKNDAGTADIANTACIIFNSRGVPIDPTGASVVDAVYVTDGSAVYGVTVLATGMIRTWRTMASARPSWTLQ